MAWHQKRVDELQLIVDQKGASIKIGEEIEITDPEVLKGVHLGVKISLSLLGKLPISLKEGE
ncbi:hypothetical protein MDMS009_816 [Methylophaga thiooxydans DMS010]|nr:hypothetical protein MDMS009_2478 [Methylophaga thiooxydans DMS010]EEF79767.1 hypothetical protein MDMS009_1705 [Methylophaga thiooxydans DMS010]EEF80359.1 hypothetical protein MDMS009_972 [Methylophaga thiooxydans DMS010]EEF80491.1 hypothetical protein MDMS009_816 [Methylophaga thiooxydans DMS010]